MPVSALADIIHCISYVFNNKNLNKKYMFKNESLYLFHNFEENLFLQSLVEGNFLFYLFFSLSFIL
jgi:hypothetical protein